MSRRLAWALGAALAVLLIGEQACTQAGLESSTRASDTHLVGRSGPVGLKQYGEGWTRLPLPPEVRSGATYVSDGSELIAWGGCDPAIQDHCRPTKDGYRFEPRTGSWIALPPAPVTWTDSKAVWTGHDVLFSDGVAYEPRSGEWHTFARPPSGVLPPTVWVWTGTEAIAWKGGSPGDTTGRGAAFDPRTNRWRRLPPSPVALNLASGVWSGREMIVFGSLLNGRNWADTATSIGAAYDPRSNTWRRIPASALSPQATSAVWVGDRMLAWDYETTWQEYDPVGNRWGPPLGMPLQFNECYPDTAMVRGLAFAFFCGDAALFDGTTRSWGVIHGGMLDTRIPANGRHYTLWRFASLAPAGSVLFLAAEGITADASGVPCYGCPGSPHSFWAYRPPRTVPHVAPKVAHGKRAARRVAEDFMDARIRRSHPLIQWLITPRASRMFGDPEAGVTEPLLSGRTYRLFGASLVGRHPTTFWVRVKLFLGRGAVSNEALLIGPGRTLGGTHAA